MSIVFSSAIKGAGDTKFVMVVMGVVSCVVMVIPSYTAVVILGHGLMSCWIFVTAYVTTLGFAFFFRFLNGSWKHMSVIGRTEAQPV